MGRRARLHWALLVGVAALLAAIGTAAAKGPLYTGWQKGPWEHYDSEDGITVWTNDQVETGVEAVRAEAMIPLPASKLFPIIIDEDRAKGYSFIGDFEILERHDDWGYLYQRVKATGVDDRDFTVRLQMVKPTVENAGPYGWQWTQANDKGPGPKDGIVRATRVQGSYLLTPVGDGTKTLVSYRVWFDPNSWVPNFLINNAVRDSATETVRRLMQDSAKMK